MRKTFDDILLYLLNPSLSHDFILIETIFPQFSIVLFSELSVCVCLCNSFNLSSYEIVHIQDYVTDIQKQKQKVLCKDFVNISHENAAAYLFINCKCVLVCQMSFSD